MQYLRSLTGRTLEDLSEKYIDEEAAKEKQWINDHPFKFIMACALYGELKPAKTDPLTSPSRFSLKTKTHQEFSLRNLTISQKNQTET